MFLQTFSHQKFLMALARDPEFVAGLLHEDGALIRAIDALVIKRATSAREKNDRPSEEVALRANL